MKDKKEEVVLTETKDAIIEILNEKESTKDEVKIETVDIEESVEPVSEVVVIEPVSEVVAIEPVNEISEEVKKGDVFNTKNSKSAFSIWKNKRK